MSYTGVCPAYRADGTRCTKLTPNGALCKDHEEQEALKLKRLRAAFKRMSR